jgi:hypothetical protein
LSILKANGEFGEMVDKIIEDADNSLNGSSDEFDDELANELEGLE